MQELAESPPLFEAPCWVENLGETIYRAHPSFSSSMARKILKSPAHLMASILEPSEQTPAMIFGTRLHQAALFGFRTLKAVARPDDYDGRKTLWKDWQAENDRNGITVLSQEDHRAITTICEKLSNDEDYRAAITSTFKERAGFANVQAGEYEFLAKVRLDCLPAGDTIIDIKTTTSAEVDDFAWSVLKYGYHIQAYHYLTVANKILEAEGKPTKQHFMFFAVEKEPPFAHRKFLLSNRFMLLAETEWMKGAEMYGKCLKDGKWPGYPDKIALIEPPRFTSERYLADEL